MLPERRHLARVEPRRRFQWAPTLGGECYYPTKLSTADRYIRFNGHPPLGVNATGQRCRTVLSRSILRGFNGHPPLGVNATPARENTERGGGDWFQWAPTLGGECYRGWLLSPNPEGISGFNGHPPLGVNATTKKPCLRSSIGSRFQWAPTLGGECYGIVYLITPPLCQGVDALLNNSKRL